MYIFGGVSGRSEYHNDIWFYDLDTARWFAAPPTTQAPKV
jgi:hypothetical protein